ncbi:MAG: DNA mismatch endonuclease Vsr [Actinomycetota bacterium]
MIEESLVTPGWYSTEYSSRLSGRKRKDTKPELLLRRALHALGGRYRLQQRVAPRILADVAFTKQKVAVFVDGCFWHGCPTHGRQEFRGPNAQNWINKIQRNRDRDTRASKQAEAEGWSVLRYWECEVKADPERIAGRILERVRGRAGHR